MKIICKNVGKNLHPTWQIYKIHFECMRKEWETLTAYLLHLFRVKKLPSTRDGGIQFIIVVQCFGIRHIAQLSLSEGRHRHLHESGKRAARGIQVSVKRVSSNKGNNWDKHSHCGDSKPPSPSHIILNINHHRHSHKYGCTLHEVVPIEVSPRARGLLGIRLVELVRPECHHARPDPARPDCP